MLKSIFDTAKEYQPISTTGIFSHTYYWLTSSSGDKYYENPSFSKEKSKDLETAVYCIHGTFDQPDAFERVARRVFRTKLPDEISKLYKCAFDERYTGLGIEDFAKQLGKQITDNGHKRVVFLAHSRGGLVAAHFAEFMAKELGIEVLLIVTIGTPFNGSYLASKPLTWFSKSVGEMEVESKYLTNLKKKIVEEPATKYHFVVAEEDVIVPKKSGYIKEYVDAKPESLTVFDRHGHLSIMSSHRLVTLIVDLFHQCLNPPANEEENGDNHETVIASVDSEMNLIDDYLPKVK